MDSSNKDGDQRKQKRPPATTPEGRENQMISLAFDQAELQLREGVAPAPVVVHYLKLATENAKLEREQIRLKNQLLIKQADQIDQVAKLEELYEEAIGAMRTYQGHTEPEEQDYDY